MSLYIHLNINEGVCLHDMYCQNNAEHKNFSTACNEVPNTKMFKCRVFHIPIQLFNRLQSICAFTQAPEEIQLYLLFEVAMVFRALKSSAEWVMPFSA